MSARFFLLRRIFRNRAGTSVPGTSVTEKLPAFHPCTSVKMGRLSPHPQTWYYSTHFSMICLLLCSSVLLYMTTTYSSQRTQKTP